jgi:beta-glucosidase-like glycosyl hydrolase/CubicO group peptidase (beta-lactamase class C family)
MSLEEKIGQLLVVTFYGGFASAESDEFRGLMRSVEQQHVGGLMVATRMSPLGIERSQVYPTALLANQLQSRAKIPLIVAADFERGTAMRITEGTSFPQAMAVAATGEPEFAYAMGRITAIEARLAAVHWIFAPSADVNSNPANPIINTRSFGEDPNRVAEFVTAFIRGVEEHGALATVKHFPGHGDTSIDSHLALPVANADRKHLEQLELVPFRAAIKVGVSAVMTAHLAVPVLEPDRDLPATLSSRIVTGLLRKDMGFAGLVVTDAMDMAGVTARYAPGEAAVRAIAAGVDVLLISPAPEAAATALRSAVRSGTLPIGRVNEAVARILRAKAKLGLHKNRLVDVDALNRVFGLPEFQRTARDVADRGITLLRNGKQLLPLDATRPVRTLLVAVAGDPDRYPAAELEREIRWRCDSLDVVRTDTRFFPAASAQLPPPESYDVAIVAVFVRVADRKGGIGLPNDQAVLVDKLIATGKPVIVACFGSPYIIERFPKAPAWLAALSTVDVAQVAMGRALFGEIPLTGRLPVSVPHAAPPLRIGAGIETAANLMKLKRAPADQNAQLVQALELLKKAVKDRAFPGGVLAVGHQGQLSTHAFGRQTYESSSARVDGDTLYDVASLTKPIVTSTLIAQEVEAERLLLNAGVGIYLPEWNGGPNRDWRQGVTLEHLLTHSSGLPAHVDFFNHAKSRNDVVQRILNEDMVYQPGTKSEYSDLDFILLGEILGRITGRPLAELARERIFEPLGIHTATFNPPKSLRPRIAPTEVDKAFRKRLIRGEVHDENAWAMGGVAGHAGLFCTAGDLSIFAQTMLNGGIYAHRRVLLRATVREFTSAHPLSHASRTLGWVVPTENSSSGHYFSAGSYGHTGFTGTSLWIDPEKQLFVVLLTNRVYPTRQNEKLSQLRPALHDFVVEGLGLTNRS